MENKKVDGKSFRMLVGGVVALTILLAGCDSVEKWANENAWTVAESFRLCKSRVGAWRRNAQKPNSDFQEVGVWDQTTFSNQVHAAMLKLLDKEWSNRHTAWHLPFFACVERFPMDEKSRKSLNRCGMKDMVAMPESQYDLEFFMAGGEKDWEHAKLYFAFEHGENMIVHVCELSKLNDRNYSVGFVLQGDERRGIGVYRVWIRHIMDINKGFDGGGNDLDSFLDALKRQKARLYWEAGVPYLTSGRHVFNRDEFVERMSQLPAVYELCLKAYSDEDAALILAVDDMKEFTKSEEEVSRPRGGVLRKG